MYEIKSLAPWSKAATAFYRLVTGMLYSNTIRNVRVRLQTLVRYQRYQPCGGCILFVQFVRPYARNNSINPGRIFM
jgi:hypothetical protein